MRRLIALTIIFLLAACSSPTASVATPRPQNAGQTVKLRVGIDASLPSFAMLDLETSAFTGLDVDVMKAIADKSNLNIEFVNVIPDQLVAFVEQCQLDAGISALAITDVLRAQVDFSEPYYTTPQVVVVKKGNLTITDREKLAGMIVGAPTGTPSEIEASKIAGAQVKPYPTFSLAFQDLITGYIDAVIADKPRAVSQTNTKPNNLKIVGNEFGNVNYGIAVCKSRSDVTKKINAGLAAIKADGTLNRLTQKWAIKVK